VISPEDEAQIREDVFTVQQGQWCEDFNKDLPYWSELGRIVREKEQEHLKALVKKPDEQKGNDAGSRVMRGLGSIFGSVLKNIERASDNVGPNPFGESRSDKRESLGSKEIGANFPKSDSGSSGFGSERFSVGFPKMSVDFGDPFAPKAEKNTGKKHRRKQ